jgi:hypothetical protein
MVMKHFFDKIQGWSSHRGLYELMVQKAKNGSHFVEVGAWKGRSAAYMCVEIINSGKDIKFDVIDTWHGTKGEHENDPDVKYNNLYNTFLKNMHPVRNIFTPIRLPSIAAANLYDDASLDFVFLDADHSYEAVKNDIISWMPKIKTGGLLSGHDECIPGVRKALHDLNITYDLWHDGVTWLYYI